MDVGDLRTKTTITAQQAGYGMKAIEAEAADDAQYNQSVAKFASGHASAQGSISNLTETNAAQQQQIVMLHNQLMQRVNSATAVTYQPMWNPSPMQYQQVQKQQGQGGGRRGRSVGRSGRGGGGWQGKAWSQMQQQPRYTQTNTNFGGGGGGGGGAAMKNPYRIFSNNEYCHLCGPHVHDGHNSATCKMPGPNHNRNATLANPLVHYYNDV